MCRMSNTPWASTTLRPSARALAAIADNSSTDLILSPMVLVRPRRAIANLRPVAKIIEPVGGGGRDARGGPPRRVAPVFDRRPHVRDALFDRHLRRPAELRLDPPRVGKGAIGLAG